MAPKAQEPATRIENTSFAICDGAHGKFDFQSKGNSKPRQGCWWILDDNFFDNDNNNDDGDDGRDNDNDGNHNNDDFMGKAGHNMS